MGTSTAYIEHLVDQAGLAARLSTRRMFGEYAVYIDGKVVAFACGNALYIKYTGPTADLTAKLPSGQAYPGSKPYAVADDLLDDGQALRQLLLATAEALPAALPKRKPRSKPPSERPSERTARKKRPARP